METAMYERKWRETKYERMMENEEKDGERAKSGCWIRKK
jgi:hypothetical protein